jgi:membrane fusion protein, heavy metal efflux system
MKTIDPTFVAIALAGMSFGCRGRVEPPPKPEAPMLNVTHWTERTELYMEYPPLVAGQSALFAVHLTRLADFKPVTAGQARVEFAPESGGPPASFIGPKPSRPGAFRVEGTPPAAGRYRWALVLDSPEVNDRHDLGVVAVFADESAARAEAAKHPADDAAAIA